MTTKKGDGATPLPAWQVSSGSIDRRVRAKNAQQAMIEAVRAACRTGRKFSLGSVISAKRTDGTTPEVYSDATRIASLAEPEIDVPALLKGKIWRNGKLLTETEGATP